MKRSLFKLSKRVLMVGTEGVVLFSVTALGTTREVAVSWQQPNFEDHLIEGLGGRNQNTPMVILFDGDQTYRKEDNIPKLNPFDRSKYLKRKLELAFPNYPVRAMIEMKRSKAERRGRFSRPSYLFAALPETEQLDRLSAVLMEASVPIAGVGLLPLESAGLTRKISESIFAKEGQDRSRWSILITQNETGGLRQVLVRDENLALARMTPVPEENMQGTEWVEEVVREFRSTLTYIARFGYNAQEGLDVVVVCGEVEKQLFDPRAFGVTNFKCITPSEALGYIGSRSSNTGPHNAGDIVHGAWTGSKVKLTVPVKVPSLQRVMGPRQIARFTTILLVLGVFGFGGLLVHTWNTYDKFLIKTEEQQAQRNMLQREYDQEAKIYDTLPVKAELVRGALNSKELLEKNSPAISPLLNVLRKVLGEDVNLRMLSYTHTPSDALSLSGDTRSRGFLSRARSRVTGDDKKASENGRIEVRFQYSLPDDMPLEQKVIEAESLLKRLEKALPEREIRIVSQFGNVSRTGSFTGAIGLADKTATRTEDYAEFEIKGAPL